jgi:large subunit ribosomal protein L24
VGAQRLDDVTALAEKFLAQTGLEGWLPQVSDTLRKYGPRVAPLKVTARIDLEPQGGAANRRTAATLKLNGSMNGIKVEVSGFGAGDNADPATATMVVGGRFDASDGRALASLIGLDALANVEPSRAARVTFAVDGAAGRTLQVNGRFIGADASGRFLAGSDLYASAEGPLTLGDGTLDVTFRAASTKLPRRAGGPAAIGVDLHGHLAIKGSEVTTKDLAGKVAGSSVKGDLTVGVGRPLKINGRIEISDQADAAELFAILTGAPRAMGPAQEWTAEPFGTPAAPPMEGSIEFKAASAQWTTGARDAREAARDARDITGAIRFDPSVSGFFLTNVTGSVANGSFVLDGEVSRSATGVTIKSHVKVTGADLPVLLGGLVRSPAAGRLTLLETDLQGQGLSPASLVGSLHGGGTLSIENLEIAGLNPAATDAVLNAVEKDRNLANDAGRANVIASAGLDAGKVKFPSMSTPVVIADGRAQLSQVQASAPNADISGLISLGLVDWQVNGRFALTGPPRKNAPNAERPAMTVTMRGQLAQAQRSVDIASLINWAQQRAIDAETRRIEEIEKERKRVEDQIEQRRKSSDAGPGGAGAGPGSAGVGGAGAAVPAPVVVSPQGTADRTVRPGPVAPAGP